MPRTDSILTTDQVADIVLIQLALFILERFGGWRSALTIKLKDNGRIQTMVRTTD